jgi:hypothetical protein
VPPIFLTIAANENVIVRKDGDPVQTLNKFELGAFARSQAEKSAEQPVVLAADKSIKYEVVMEVMSKLKENGVTYNVYNADYGGNRAWKLDPIPFLIHQRLLSHTLFQQLILIFATFLCMEAVQATVCSLLFSNQYP